MSDLRSDMQNRPTCIGDGVYASYSGGMIKLTTERDGHTETIWLENVPAVRAYTRTQIIIISENRDLLKAHPIWSQIMDLFLNDGPIMVEEISDADLPASRGEERCGERGVATEIEIV